MSIVTPQINPAGKPSPLHPALPSAAAQRVRWEGLRGSARGLVISRAALEHTGPLLVIAEDTPSAQRLEDELRFYLGQDVAAPPLLHFPDWETLPYDTFSPHSDIISERLTALYRLPSLTRGILIAPAPTLMHRLAPREYMEARSLVLDTGQTLDSVTMRRRLETNGYRCVSQVMEHGEFAVRGSLIDLFPMGSAAPYRIDLFDDRIESLRRFDPESQRTLEQIRQVRLLPAHEFPLDEQGVTRFRHNFREQFEGDPQKSPLYRDVSQGLAPAGIEYYLPLFFERTHTLFDYLPGSCLVLYSADIEQAADRFWREANERYEQVRYDRERPLLAPGQLFLQTHEVFGAIGAHPHIAWSEQETDTKGAVRYAAHAPPALALEARSAHPLNRLRRFLENFTGRVLFAAESAGRREALLELLAAEDMRPAAFPGWPEFLNSEARLGITVAPLEQGLLLDDPSIAVIAEPQLFGEQAAQRRRRATTRRDVEGIVKSLAELRVSDPVVHEQHGVGRYLGLQTLTAGGVEAEFLALKYAGGDKLYVPISSLHLISRYTGVNPEHAPLHKLGGEQWDRARRKALERVRDVAAELLEIYARRAARQGHAFAAPDTHYAAFAATFPFEETPDQLQAIHDVLADMQSGKPMDRLVCGDVGFGKTEVALRAAFIATQGGKQVVLLTPTTLLAQQHHQTFQDRFAGWPVRIEVLSRLRTPKQQQQTLQGLAAGTVDIVIGTHKLLSPEVRFKNLGLVIIDEEHRFGVRHKERLKQLRSEVDILTLTATPIPRTLGMAFANLRELSIIATPPARRLVVKTFVREWDKTWLREALLREILRGGQVYFLHNDVDTMPAMLREIETLAPEASVRIAHGQMRERELEQVMLDFYHQRFNVLLCSTIIESGIDVPSANTIIINRADKFGLAQLYQLRGRVGRSHHSAYAYLIIPDRRAVSADALKRLDAIEAIQELGAGFTLAAHDLEIRGAGEMLGEEQSGQIQEIGYTLYTDLLERAVNALKEGREPELERPLDQGAEIDIRTPALIPEDYLPDVHARLVLYKRIASAGNEAELRELQVEMIDRFGLLPEATKTLFKIAELKLRARVLGIRKMEAGESGARISFGPQPAVDPMKIIELIQKQPKVYKLDGQDKLRVTVALPDVTARIQKLEQILQLLCPSPRPSP
ncbi:MAG: transcription-repair coupling factor [Gammaproteobacteria bacterium]|nr:transcription-repair coupling factor [Gammaproteobacteria bacterium]